MITRLNSLGFNELVDEYEVTGSAATTITFDGLDINADGGYTIVESLVSAAECEVSLDINGDSGSNYTRRFIHSSTTTLVTNQDSKHSLVATGTVGTTSFAKIDLTLIGGYACWNSQDQKYSTAQAACLFNKHNTAQTNIISLVVRAATSGALDVGSKIKIYRWKQGIKTLNSFAQGRLVWEHTVTGSAVSSVTATGLDILRDGSYKVIVGAIATGGTRVDCRMYVNGDTADGNYTTRYINGSGTTVVTNSLSAPLFGVLETTASTLDYVVGDVSLVNGYMCFNMSVNIVTSAALHFGKHNVSQSNITQLSFVAPSGNTYAAGSKFYILRTN